MLGKFFISVFLFSLLVSSSLDADAYTTKLDFKAPLNCYASEVVGGNYLEVERESGVQQGDIVSSVLSNVLGGSNSINLEGLVDNTIISFQDPKTQTNRSGSLWMYAAVSRVAGTELPIYESPDAIGGSTTIRVIPSGKEGVLVRYSQPVPEQLMIELSCTYK